MHERSWGSSVVDGKVIVPRQSTRGDSILSAEMPRCPAQSTGAPKKGAPFGAPAIESIGCMEPGQFTTASQVPLPVGVPPSSQVHHSPLPSASQITWKIVTELTASVISPEPSWFTVMSMTTVSAPSE